MRVPRLWPVRNTAPDVSGSSREGASAGNSHPKVALVQGFWKGWTVDGGLLEVDKK